MDISQIMLCMSEMERENKIFACLEELIVVAVPTTSTDSVQLADSMIASLDLLVQRGKWLQIGKKTNKSFE